MKKVSSLLVLCLFIISTLMSTVIAAGSNITYATGVTEEMCKASYWYNKSGYDSNTIMMSTKEIAGLNTKILSNSNKTHLIDLLGASDSFDVNDIQTSLCNSFDSNKKNYFDWSYSTAKDTLYINGEICTKDNDTYFTDLREKMTSNWLNTDGKTRFAVCTKYAEMKGLPTNDVCGYSSGDTDDEFMMCSLCVNEPVYITLGCKIDDETFYYCYSAECDGWVNANNLAICKDKTEWLNAWQVSTSGSDFLVVTQDKIVTEKSKTTPNSSEVKLTLGSILKLVPKNQMSSSIGERATWNNYVVYLPVRNSDGTYTKEQALISQHYSVSVGFLPFTQKNLLDISFSCLGNRYGWGGSLDSFDCSLYTRMVYRCFGFELPRNTLWQCEIPDSVIDVSSLGETDKEKLIETLPAGALLYFSDAHAMIYAGSENGTNYVISDVGSLCDSYEGSVEQTISSVVLNPLTVKRKTQKTWLSHLDKIVLVSGVKNINTCTATATKTCKQNYESSDVTVKYNGKILTKNINYTVTYINGTAKITGINNFQGSLSVNVQSNHKYVRSIKKATKTKNGYIKEVCSLCGAIKTNKKLYKVKRIKLAKGKYKRTGKNIKPKVIVKNSQGKQLKKGKDYKVTYPKISKATGLYTVKVKLKGNYSGKKTLYFEVVKK